MALALTLAASACGGGGDASTAAPAGMSAGAATYSVGGSVSGLGPGLSLQLLNNGGDAVTVGGNGGFRFPGKLSAGATYAATVGTRPSGQQCTIDKGSGTVANADVADIAVTCSARPLFAYVANADDNTVQAFALDPATGAATGVGRPAAVGHGPVSLVADPAGTTLYVVNASDNTVTTLAIHPDTGAVSVSAPAVRTGASPLSIARAPAGPFAYTANAGDNTLSIFKMSAKAEAPAPRGVVQAGSNPYTVAVNGTGTFAYVVNAAMVSGAPSVMAFAINGATGALVPAGSPAATGHAPFFIALHPAGRFAYVANFADDTLSVYAINGATGALAPAGSPVATGGNPFAIAIHPSGRFAYVANVFSGTISLFANRCADPHRHCAGRRQPGCHDAQSGRHCCLRVECRRRHHGHLPGGRRHGRSERGSHGTDRSHAERDGDRGRALGAVGHHAPGRVCRPLPCRGRVSIGVAKNAPPAPGDQGTWA
ncbi:lactonase family protein [Ralstonia nicotianae]